MRKELLAASMAFACLGAPAIAQEEYCDRYVIRGGDTLSALSRAIFGDINAFMRFYDDPRNVDSLGENPNRISVGDVLFLLPCDVSAEPVSLDARTIDRSQRPIEIVTASDFAPFTDEDLAGRGLLTQIVSDAFAMSDLENEVSIDFVNDWGSHLETLLPKMKFTFGFPWYRPDCSNRRELSRDMARRCDLLWSDPLFSVVIGFYAPSSRSEVPQDFAGMEGSTICRPDGYFTFDLEQNGLVAGETITLEQPPTVQDCFEALEEGSVDFVSINRFTAERAIAEAGLTDFVSPLQTVVSTQDLHLVGAPGDPDAARWMAKFNEALAELKSTGRFAQISRRSIEEHQDQIDSILR